MRDVVIGEFAAQIRRRRRELRMSQDDLARRASVSKSTIQRLERLDPGDQSFRSERPTIIDLSAALGLDTDVWLRVLGYEPLTEVERTALVAPAVDLWGELQSRWPLLTPVQQQALVALVAAITNPADPAAGLPGARGEDPEVGMVRRRSGASSRERRTEVEPGG